MCSFQGATMINRRAHCRLPLWPIEAPSIAPSFHEPFGCCLIFHHSLCTFFSVLFPPETCFGTGSGVIRCDCQYRLPSGDLKHALAALDLLLPSTYAHS